MRPVAACFRPRTWPISWARTAPRRCRTSSVARSGCERCRQPQLQLEPLVGDAWHGDQDGGRPAVRRERRQAARRACGRHQDHGHARSRPVPSRAGTGPVARMPVHDHSGRLEERVGNLRRSVAIRRIDRSGHEGPHPDAGSSARLSRTSVHTSAQSGPATPGPERGSEPWDASASSTSVLIANVGPTRPRVAGVRQGPFRVLSGVDDGAGSWLDQLHGQRVMLRRWSSPSATRRPLICSVTGTHGRLVGFRGNSGGSCNGS